MTEREFPKTYDPHGIEKRWYSTWETAGYFHAKAADRRRPFTIVIPPPNVTGSLHMGHALDNTLQDILIRYKRMDGFATLWLPGTDHAGIATQNVVERELAKEGLTRQALGREKFIERVWKWKEESGGKIIHQLKRLGASCDWERTRFTMDEGLSRAVRTVFVTLYREGLIYRSSYLISWCPRCRTALSDLEVEHEEIGGHLTYFRYKTKDGKEISVATTRPETMLGDTAVAVHPDDPRYRVLIGTSIQHHFVDRTFPIIADKAVDPRFGTGAVKVTPAHDPTDYEIGKRHSLPFLTILDEEAKMTSDCGVFAGMDRFVARKRVVESLKEQGLLDKIEPHRHAVGHCQRCRTIVEPRISKQWFVRIAPLAKPAIAAVRQKQTGFIPDNWTKTYLHWMENIRDWCISRQLWWGHQIPVWYCDAHGHETVAVEVPTKCSSCASIDLTQDPDVLDTWFSSALWPFSTLGWPEKTADLRKFYPTQVLVTGFDIIFFWVARMMMMGIKFMKRPPFRIVHIHALVRDEKGQKMSKSKGNVVDPLEIMDRYGADAFRFALAAFAIQGRDIPLSEKRIEGYRNFMTKLWNAARFALGQIGDDAFKKLPSPPKTLPDRWIRVRLNEVTRDVRRALDEMKFNEAAEAIYQFTWHEVCDWYLELVKPHFALEASAPERKSSAATLTYLFDRLLRLLHPFAPFITEEIWQLLPITRRTPSIMLAAYPKPDSFRDSKALREFRVIRSLVEATQNIRSENKIPPRAKLDVFIRLDPRHKSDYKIIENNSASIAAIAGIQGIQKLAGTPPPNSAMGLAGTHELHVPPVPGIVDVTLERERLAKEQAKARADREFLEKRLSDPRYREKAPPHLIERDEGKLADTKLRLEKIERSIATLDSGG